MAEKAATEKRWFSVSLLLLLSRSETGFLGAYLGTRVYNEENLATYWALRKLRNMLLNCVFKSVRKVKTVFIFNILT